MDMVNPFREENRAAWSFVGTGNSRIEDINEVGKLSKQTSRERWEIFMMSMKTKSIRYSTRQN